MADQQRRDEGGQGSAAPPRQQADPQRAAEEGGRGLSRPGGPGHGGAVAHAGKVMSDPDVVLQIPYVKVEQLYIQVDDLDAHLSLRSRLGNLLQLDVGVQARLGIAKIDIKGVETEAMLAVRLEQLQGILDRALSTIDRNPQIIEAPVGTVDTAVNQVGQTTGQPGPNAQPTRGGTSAGSPGRTAWQRMKKMVHSNQPLRRVTARLVGSAAGRRQRGA